MNDHYWMRDQHFSRSLDQWRGAEFSVDNANKLLFQ